MSQLDRRTFLKRGSAAAGTVLLPEFAVGQSGPSANSKVNVALIGGGGVAHMAYSGCAGENIVAICDVDENMAAGGRAKHPKAKSFKDFRVMLDQIGKEIDAVVVSTPDHTHFAATLAAMERGKHVYTQKPLTHNIWQARTLRKAREKYKVVTQMGNQGHATDGIRYVKEWYESGAIGAVRKVHTWNAGPNWESRFFGKPFTGPPSREEVPSGLDWDLWCGPCKSRPYSRAYHPRSWRGWWDFGNGPLGDWFCHTGDAPVWALDLDGPVSVELVERDSFSDLMVPNSGTVKWEFPARGDRPPVTLHWSNGGKKPAAPEGFGGKLEGGGMMMVGDKHTLMTGGRPNSPRMADDEFWANFRRNLPAPTIPRVKGGPFAEWLDAIKGNGPEPGSNFDYAARLTEIALLGCLVQRVGGRIAWDHENGTSDRRELEGLIREPAREGWDYGEDLWKG